MKKSLIFVVKPSNSEKKMAFHMRAAKEKMFLNCCSLDWLFDWLLYRRLTYNWRQFLSVDGLSTHSKWWHFDFIENKISNRNKCHYWFDWSLPALRWDLGWIFPNPNHNDYNSFASGWKNHPDIWKKKYPHFLQ